MKSSVYRPTSHSSIERFFLTFSQLIRKLFKDESEKWSTLIDYVTAIYNNSHHTALRGHTPNSAHFNFLPGQTKPSIYELLDEGETKHPFLLEEQRLYTRALRIFNEAGLQKYFELKDKKGNLLEKRGKHRIGPQVGDLVWLRILRRLNKHPTKGYLHGPALVINKPSKQQIEVLYIKSGRTAIKHYSHAVQFFRPICTDAEELLAYSTAPRLYHTYEGRRVSPEERKKLINELEKGLPGGTYLSPMDDLAEIDTMLEDKFNLTDYPWEYDEEITKKRRELFESNTVEGETMRQSVEDLAEEEEVPEEIDKKKKKKMKKKKSDSKILDLAEVKD